MNRLNKTSLFLDTHGQWLVILAVIFYILIFSFISLWKYYNFSYNAMDLAIINQVFYNSNQGNFFASSIHPPTYLGDHFTPIIFLLLPFYLPWPTPQILLILQTVLLGLGAWPIYLIAKKVLTKNWATGLALAWLLNPFVQNINLFEFSFLPLAVFFILWAFYFYQREDFFVFLFFCFLAFLVREDVALVILMFGLIAALEKKSIRWWLTPLLLSLTYWITASVITSSFTPAHFYKYFVYYSWLDPTPILALQNLIFEPWRLIFHLFKIGNLEFILGLFLPLVFLPLINPWYLLLGLLTFLQLILRSDGASATLLETHYASLLLPVVFIATIYSLAKIISNKPAQQKIILIIKQFKGLAFLIFTTGLIYSFLTLSPIIGTLNKVSQNGLMSSASQIKNKLIEKIPKDSAVAATYEFITPLSSRRQIYSFNYAFLGKQQFLTADYSLPENTEYIVLDYSDLITYQLQYGNNPFYQKQYQIALKNWTKNLAGFGLIEIKDSLALYQKGTSDKFSLVKELTARPALEQEKNVTLDENVKFLGFNKAVDHYQLFWEVDFPLEKNYQLKITLNDGNQKIYPFAYGQLQSDEISGKKIIQTNYWFEPKNPEISLIEIKGGGVEIDEIRATKNVIDKEISIGQKIILEKN